MQVPENRSSEPDSEDSDQGQLALQGEHGDLAPHAHSVILYYFIEYSIDLQSVLLIFSPTVLFQNLQSITHLGG